MEEEMDFQAYGTIILLGDQGVGKTSLCQRYVSSIYPIVETGTSGLYIEHKIAQLGEITALFSLYDFSGLRVFRKLRQLYYPYASGLLLVYDQSNPTTLKNLRGWKKEFTEVCKRTVPIGVVGTKVDLVQKVKGKTMNKLIRELGQYHIRTSVVTGENVEETFEKLFTRILNGVGDKCLTGCE